MKRKAFIGYIALVRLIIGVMFAILAFSIAKGCAQGFFKNSNEAANSFDEFANMIERVSTTGESDTALLIMDDNTLILGYTKNADSIELKVPGVISSGDNRFPNNIWKVVRPPRACGTPGSNACVCLCKELPKFDSDLGYYVCGSLQCRKMSSNVDFKNSVYINELIPDTYPEIDIAIESGSFVVNNGFIIDRFQNDEPIFEPYRLSISKDPKAVSKLPETRAIPRRLPVTIQKVAGKTEVCLRKSCEK